jgi:hypothetical protein
MKDPKTELELTANEKPILGHLRLAFREIAGKADAARIAKMTVLAFRLEFPNAATQNKLANAYVRGIPALRKVLADEGGSISAAEVAGRLGLSKSTVLRRYREKRLLGWRDFHGAEIRFPVWQFTGRSMLPGFDEVMKVLRTGAPVDDIACVLFFLSQFHSLDGQRPLDCLREGNVQAAVQTAYQHIQ